MKPDNNRSLAILALEFALWVVVAAMMIFAAFGCTPNAYSTRPEAPAVYLPADAMHAGAYAVDEMSPCRMLRSTDDPNDARIVFHFTDEAASVCGTGLHYDGDSASAFQCAPSGRWEVWIAADAWSRWTLTQRYIVVAHELGHALGLLDAGRTSPAFRGIPNMMTRNALEHADRLDRGLPLPTLAPHDREYLEHRYCSASEPLTL